MELLQRRKFCREFLNGYNEKLHPQIISKVFEIGLLTLKNSYNKLLFSKEELDDIIKALSGKDFVEIVPLPPLKSTQNERNNIPSNNDYNNTNDNGEIIKNKILRNTHRYDNRLKNPNFITQNSAIYPNWWWNNKEEEEEKDKEKVINYNHLNYTQENNNDYNYNDEEYEENEINDNYMNINKGDDNNEYQEYYNNEMNNIQNKNYTIKKLSMYSDKPVQANNKHEISEEHKYYEKENKIPSNNQKMRGAKMKNNVSNKYKKIEPKQRDKNIKPPTRKVNSFSKKGERAGAPKTNPKSQDKNRKKNPIISQIPRNKYTYVNGKILKIPEDNKRYINLNMTEPNH